MTLDGSQAFVPAPNASAYEQPRRAQHSARRPFDDAGRRQAPLECREHDQIRSQGRQHRKLRSVSARTGCRSIGIRFRVQRWAQSFGPCESLFGSPVNHPLKFTALPSLQCHPPSCCPPSLIPIGPCSGEPTRAST